MTGYDPGFLGHDITLPLPTFAPNLAGHVLRNQTTLRDGYLADYVNYTVATHEEERAPIYAVLNYDKSKRLGTDRSDDWQIDTRIGADFQLNNDYYRGRRNPWDRGHLARRATAGWGNDPREAQRAADETFYYSNASLQHRNFNRDEWVALEDWVMNLDIAHEDRITVYSGPVHGDFSRTIRPAGRRVALIPMAFFKIVCFLGEDAETCDDRLDVRAFLMYQDADALAHMRGRRNIDFQSYQVTVSEIEELTGLEFDDAIYERNPLRFHENEEIRRELNISHFPERIEVSEPEEIVDATTPRDYFADEEVQVYIAAAMVNPRGSDRDEEWISIVNLSDETIDLAGWQLSDTKRAALELSDALESEELRLEPGEAVRVEPVRPLMLANTGGVIVLYAPPEAGQTGPRRICRVMYTDRHARRVGVPVVFGNQGTTPVADD